MHLRSLEDIGPIAANNDITDIVRAERVCHDVTAQRSRVVQKKKVAVAEHCWGGAALHQKPTE